MPDGDRSFVVTKQAWSTLVVKSFEDDLRTFEGIASTPATDRQEDIVEPLGAQFKLPIPMKWQHGKDARIGNDQIGEITSAVTSKDGVFVKGRFWKFAAPPSLKDDYDRIWALVKAGMRGLSIGFNPLAYEPIKGGGLRFTKWAFLELSPVTIAANQDATITSIKSYDLASSGTRSQQSPGASGTSSIQPRSRSMKGIPDQIAVIEDERAKAAARIDELKTKCNGDPDELAAEEQQELDDLGGDLVTHDAKLKRLHTMQGSISKAFPVSPAVGSDPDRASRARAGDFQMKSNLPKGTMFVRAVMAKVRGQKELWSSSDTAEYARRTWPDTPEVAQYLKAAVGTGAAGNWAEPLSVVRVIENEFIELLRPATIIGKLGLRPAPFNTKMIRRVNVTSSANWVGNGAVKPVGEGDYDTVEILTHKIAEIIVLTEDLVLSSAIDAVEATRVDLIERVAAFADDQFTDPAVASGANNPASVLHGVTPITAGGSTAEDFRNDFYRLLSRFMAANIPLSNITVIMSSYNALGLAGLRNALGAPEFPNVGVNGGTLDAGVRVIVSNNVGGDSSGSNIIALVPMYILLAQSGGIRVDMSREATISLTGAGTADHSLWQRNEIGLRCEWFVSWAKAHAEAAQYISSASYFPQPAA